MVKVEYKYEDHTWPEMKEEIKKGKVVVLMVGSIEQHGPALPLGTDSFLGYEVCRRACEKIQDDALLLPPVYFGVSEHHVDFPGTIAISGETLVRYVTEICQSLVRHGFRKILLVSGHGGNTQTLEAVVREIALRTDALCMGLMYFSLITDELKELRESEMGGIGHACEAETSMMLHVRPELVKKELVRRDGILKSDLLDSVPHDPNKRIVAFFIEPFSKWTKSGIIGDATTANAVKGEKWVEAASNHLAELIKQFKARPIPQRVDHHY
ncbi:MAG: creatininase family protein [Candidatus Bathyarchaeia archaeon]